MDRLGTGAVVGAGLALASFTSSIVWLATYLFAVDDWPLVIAAFVVSFSGVMGLWGMNRVRLDIARMQHEHYATKVSTYTLQSWVTEQNSDPMPDASKATEGTYQRDISLVSNMKKRNLTIVESLSPNTQKWYAAMSNGLRWAWQLNSLQSRDLVGQGRAFNTPDGWSVWKNVLATSGMITSTPGAGTKWNDGWSFKRAVEFFDNASPIVFPAQKAPSVMPWTATPLPPPSEA